MKINVHGGTARSDEPSLCLTCRYASIVQGSTASQRIVRCSRVEGPIEFKVSSCTEFLHRAHPSLYHMEDIAWVLRTDVRRGQIGFVRSKDVPLAERFVVDEE